MPGAEALVVCVYRPVLPAAGAALLGAPATRPVLVVPDTHPALRADGDDTDHASGRTLAGALDRQTHRA